jgi:hypothetical protein
MAPNFGSKIFCRIWFGTKSDAKVDMAPICEAKIHTAQNFDAEIDMLTPVASLIRQNWHQSQKLMPNSIWQKTDAKYWYKLHFTPKADAKVDLAPKGDASL